MDDLLNDFVSETVESLTQIDAELVRLEQTPNDPELLGSIFRLVHTIKGTCGFIGLQRLERVAHAGENILGKFRDGILPVTPEAVTLILKSIDTIQFLVGELRANGAEPDGEDGELIALLNAFADRDPGAAVVAEVKPTIVEVKEAVAAAPVVVPDEHGFVPVPAEAAEAPQLPKPPADRPKPVAAEGEAANAGATVRVGIEALEHLMTMVSELVLTRNQLLQILRSQMDGPFSAPLHRLNQVTSELQEGVMKTRMQPICNAWSKLPRIVRDLAVETGKKIELQMNGGDTELDRQVLELIKDPLTHMVRNSGDHGIETPAERRAAGKSEVSTITLNAYHEGGHIIIEIADDGRGLAIDKIKAKALQNGLATAEELQGMSDQQIMQFIFKAGFSTAATVSAISGRGVGMDVVRTNIEKIGGTIDMQSVQGKGTKFQIKIPLTLAIISALIVECMSERFAIPQTGVVELVHASANSEHRIELINDTPVLRLRKRLLPLISLRETLGLGEANIKPDDHAFIIVAQVGNSNFGLIVDRVHDTEEIVVKPVSSLLRSIGVFSGNTILGDGQVIMILDMNGIVAEVGGIANETASAVTEDAAARHKAESHAFLLFQAQDGIAKAVPLSLVARLEEIDRARIEYAGGTAMMQYRGGLMPLIPMDGEEMPGREGKQKILVFSDRGRHMGLMVEQIVDIVEERLQIDLSSKRPGYLGTSVIDEHATDIIDADYYLRKACDDWFNVATDGAFGDKNVRRVLMVDDSRFFLNLMKPVLTIAGYDVTAVENPLDALKLQDAGEDYDVIVSDIEMPGMNGFEFVTALRSKGRWSGLPIVAMSSHATSRDFDRGRQAGFTSYIAKHNREGLLNFLASNFNDLSSEAMEVRA
ncbi:MAG TPA: hybrid sensor histidine kinase/response regulator [Alphaproteobacteria bacterium]|nr:hybrid sensor histidine kinase/response regulator [Alphaproteobacteria bacterium]